MIKNKKNLSERLLPFAVVLIFALSLGVSMYMKKHNLGLERLIGIEGGGMVMAIFIALLLFAIKGVVMFIPLSGLYLAVGAVMNDEIIAFLVNLTGIVICLSIAYFNGTKITVERAKEIYRKFPKIKMLDDFESENSLLFSFLIRIFGIVPCDVVSMYCGIKKNSLQRIFVRFRCGHDTRLDTYRHYRRKYNQPVICSLFGFLCFAVGRHFGFVIHIQKEN